MSAEAPWLDAPVVEDPEPWKSAPVIEPGMRTPGNIDVTKRPVVKNPDGTISTVRSMSIGTDQGEVLIPTVSDDGRIMPDNEAIQTYFKTGRHLGVFDTPDNATKFAERLHSQQEAMYSEQPWLSAPVVEDAKSESVRHQKVMSRGFEDMLAQGQAELKPTPLTPVEESALTMLQQPKADAASVNPETIRRFLTPLLGPTEAERIEKSIPWGKDAQGNPTYVYKPLGSRLEQEAGLMTPFAKVDPLAPKEGDSALAATGKAAFNTVAGLENSLLSPAGALLPVAGEVPAIGRTVSGAFAADMATHIPGQLEQMATGKTLQEKIEGGLGAASSTLMALAAGTHAAGGKVLGEAEATAPEAPTAAPESTRPAAPAEAPLPVGDEAARGPSPEDIAADTAWFNRRMETLKFFAEGGETAQFSATLAEGLKGIRDRYSAKDRPAASTQFFEEAGKIAKEHGLDAEQVKTDTRLQLGRMFGADAPEMAKELFGDIKKPSAPLPATGEAVPSPASSGEGGTELPQLQSPIRENKAKTSLVLPNGDLVVGGRFHGETFDYAEKLGAATYDELVNSKSGFTQPDGRTWDLQGKDMPTSGKIIDLEELQKSKQSSAETRSQNPEVAREQAPVPAGEGVGAKLGPGAANIEEPLASYELRKFGERFVEDKTIDPTIREQTGNRYYEPIPNRVTAEEATKIVNERGLDQAISLVRDEKNDLSHAVRSTIGQVAIKQLNESYRALKDTNPVEAEKVLNKTVDLAEWQMDYGTRLGQGVQSFAMWSRLTPEGQLRVFEKGIEKAKKTAQKKGGDISKIPKMTDEIKTEITKLTQDIEAAPEGIPKQDATKKLADYMASKLGYSPWDLPLGIYYAHILSGYNTHLVNAIDTGLNVMSDVGVMAVNNPRAIPSLFEGLVKGLSEGKADALLALSEGRTVTSGKFTEQPSLFEASKFGQKGGVPISEVTRTGRVFKKIAESKVAYPLNAYKYVSRIMAASDTVFFRGAQEARSAMLAYREAFAKGKEGADLKAEINRVLGYDRIDEFRKQAEKEGYKGAKKEARTTELMIQSRPEEIRDSSADFAGASTYNHAPEGLLGYFSNKVAQMAGDLPALKLIVPFTRIVANVTNRGLDYTPYGYKRALAGRTFGEGKMFGDARTAQLTKATAGTAGLIGLAILNQTGIVQVHGGGPSDPQKRRQLQSAGWKPYSLQIGDTYISYLPTPLGLGLSSLGNYLDSNRYQELKQKDAITRTAYSVSRIPSTVFNQSFLSNLAGTFKALSSSSPGEQISELKKLFSRTTSAFITPSLAKDINRVFDPSYRDSDSIAEDVVRDIPVARLALRPSLNAYGEVAEQPSNRFVSTRKSDPAWRIVVEKNLRIPVADETTFTTPEAGYEYQKLSGQRIKRYVESNLSSLKSMTTDKAQESITRAWSDISENARSEVRARFPNSLKQRK